MTKLINEHPDAAAIRDWALYGPRDPQIAILVERLAIEHGMRLDDVERLIVDKLTAELHKRSADSKRRSTTRS